MKKKLNIVMFGHKRIPSREGGIEIVVKELSTRMVEMGYDVTCYNRGGHHVSGVQFDTFMKYNSILSDSYKGVKLQKVWTINYKGLAAITSSFAAAWKASISNCNVVHIHAEGPAAMSWLPKLRHKKVVVTIHGLDWAREKWGSLATHYIKFGEKMAVKYADEIIVLSHEIQKYFKNVYGRETVVLSNGVSRPKIRDANEIRKLWKLEKDSYVLFLGRIVPEKGLRYLIEAWKGIKTDRKLVIAGGSSDTDKFVKELKKIANVDVIFTGFIQGRILEELYSNAYIYCLPSDIEGMPLSLLEAMSYGNCCLVSSIPECVEVVEDKAIVFKKSNVTDLREKLQELLEDKERVIKYKRNAADFICKKYTWDDVVRKTVEIYKN
jgi:glycosyltransferase involved in cell wall biosynthesis